VEKVLPISLKINFTPNALGCYGLRMRPPKLTTLTALVISGPNCTCSRDVSGVRLGESRSKLKRSETHAERDRTKPLGLDVINPHVMKDDTRMEYKRYRTKCLNPFLLAVERLGVKL